MLVLSRKVDEAIVIDGDIRLKVVAIQGNGVRLGIEAPAEVVILRSELAPPDAAPRPRRRRDSPPGNGDRV